MKCLSLDCRVCGGLNRSWKASANCYEVDRLQRLCYRSSSHMVTDQSARKYSRYSEVRCHAVVTHTYYRTLPSMLPDMMVTHFSCSTTLHIRSFRTAVYCSLHTELIYLCSLLPTQSALSELRAQNPSSRSPLESRYSPRCS
jgi:hypothetical protein